MTLTVGSLFTGIGGLDLGLERAGMTVAWQVENDPYCNRVLAKHWPDVKRYGDIKELDPNDLAPVDLICGGFPCQPVSLAGARRGQDDERWLWPEYGRMVRHLRPRFVLVENVPGLLVRGMGDVLGDLASLGYDTEWTCVSAAAVGAPHLRRRIFVVANADSQRHDGDDGVSPPSRFELRHPPRGDAGSSGAVQTGLADTHGERLEEQWGTEPAPAQQPRIEHGRDVEDTQGERCRPFWADTTGEARPDDIFGHAGEWLGSGAWATEPDVGRVANGVPSRVDRLRGLGNAVVPQVAEYIGRRILRAAA